MARVAYCSAVSSRRDTPKRLVDETLDLANLYIVYCGISSRTPVTD